ncbi:GmrSD restriction endonuclease domain-containing protein [Phaeodactylibacter xiamenensis]|uniref:GmrSD restriction endonuclease domain-containing protein n=1 Tax=Phaeodactylibacter xiamenensis TaxID=1524460 RepID=UPI003BAD5CB7
MSKTFWDVIREQSIEIPEIQRDYAQGRKSERVNAIRKSFVSDLLDAISGEGSKLNLAFVFGQSVDRTNQANFEKSKRSLEQMLAVLERYSEATGVGFKSEIAPKPVTSGKDSILIPFDGQQRLTTLFLLHVFIGAKANKDIADLKRFKYKTRESSSSFTEKLVESRDLIASFEINPDVKEESSISACLKNQPWFFRSWEKDPTVSGMLVMLDEIERQLIEKDIDVHSAWDNLVKKFCIEFDFFDIQEGGFDEDLYVKMNARGKALTDFENFRAWLEKKHKNNKKLEEYDWINKLDKQWLDAFWKTKKEVKDVDINFLAFFKNMGLFWKISEHAGSSDKEYKKERDLISLLKSKRFTSTSEYEKEEVFTKESLAFIFTILDIVTDEKKDVLDNKIKEVWTATFNTSKASSFTKLLLTDFDGLNLYHKTFLFALLRFLTARQKLPEAYTEEDWAKLVNWMRVARNVIYNSRIDDDRAYIPAIQALSQLEDQVVFNTYEELCEISTEEDQKKWITFFNREQQQEECNKIALLSKGENGVEWDPLIKTAENHFYFYGQIGFILDLSGRNLQDFDTYLTKLEKLFCKENVDSDTFILQSLFFAFDDKNTWLESLSANRYMFYKPSRSNSRDRNENWRIVFKRSVLKTLLDSSTCELDAIQSIINEKKKELGYANWKFFILDEPAMLKYCQSAMLAIRPDGDVRLLSKSRNYSQQRELRTWHYYIKHKDAQFPPFPGFWYYTGERGNNNPCLVFEGWEHKGEKYYMDCRFERNKFVLILGRRTEGEIDPEIIETLESQGFIKMDKRLKSQAFDYEKLESTVNEIRSTLNKINGSAHE